MPTLANVVVHSSVFPENVERDLLQSLRARRVDPKFHYASYKQSRKWLLLHETYSPARTDAGCLETYERSFKAAARAFKSSAVRLIGLGCGGGQKDIQLLSALQGQGKEVSYAPCDISLSLVLTASLAAEVAIPKAQCNPLVCDFARAVDLPQVFNQSAPGPRLYTFFGMIPNFEPETIMPRLAALIRPGDLLLVSANLAPGADYAAGAQQVLPGYDNAQTRDWLLTFLHDLGVEPGDGSIQFSVEDSASGYKRIVADYAFSRSRAFEVHDEPFKFGQGDQIRLFFSYRYTPGRMASLLLEYNLSILENFITPSDEEGVFLCGRAGG